MTDSWTELVSRLDAWRRAADAGQGDLSVLGSDRAAEDLADLVRSVERHLGIELIGRVGGAWRLTEAGVELASLWTDLLRRLQQWQVKHRGDDTDAGLRLGVSTGSGNYFLIATLAGFKARHPGVNLDLFVDISRSVVEAVTAGAIRLGVVGYEYPEPGLTYRRLLEDRFVLLVHPEDEFAGRPSVTPQEVFARVLLVEQEGSGSRRALWSELSARGFDLDRQPRLIELGLHESLKKGVLSRMGIAWLPSISAEKELATGALVGVKVEGLDLVRHFYLVHRREVTLTELERNLVDHIVTDLADRGR